MAEPCPRDWPALAGLHMPTLQHRDQNKAKQNKNNTSPPRGRPQNRSLPDPESARTSAFVRGGPVCYEAALQNIFDVAMVHPAHLSFFTQIRYVNAETTRQPHKNHTFPAFQIPAGSFYNVTFLPRNPRINSFFFCGASCLIRSQLFINSFFFAGHRV